MALGGYKFAGYKVTKPENATDAEWALLIHKARLKAFWDANTASGAGWVFDKTSGHAYWNGGTGVGGDVIYYADGDNDSNLVSFFRNGTGADAKYYLIATLFKWQDNVSGALTGFIRINPGAISPISYGGSQDRWIVNQKTLFHTVSYSEFPEDCLSASSNSYPADALTMLPICGWTATSASANTNGGTEKISNANAVYIGCAVKGSNIITFTTRIDTLPLSKNYQYTKVSLIGFDGLNLSSPADSTNIYGISLTPDGNEIGVATWGSSLGPFTIRQSVLTDTFTRYFQNDSTLANGLYLTEARRAMFNGVVSVYPFESVTLTTNGTRIKAPFLNSDGIASKGAFNIDLLACNGTNSYEKFSTWNSVANGNYLTALVHRCSAGDNASQTTYYVGWDPSNPDITNPDSWQEYTEEEKGRGVDNPSASRMIAYLTSNGADEGGDTPFMAGRQTPLYGADGNPIPYDNDKNYTLTGLYQALVEFEQEVEFDDVLTYLTNDDGYLALLWNDDPSQKSDSEVFLHHVRYTKED